MYFYNYIKRRSFIKKWLPCYNKLKELLAGRIAYSDYIVLINKALDKDLAQNKGIIKDDTKNSIKEINDLNLLYRIVKRSPSGMLIKGQSPTPLPSIPLY